MSRTVISPVPGRSVVALTVLLCLLAGVVGAADQRGVYTLIREGVSHRVQSLSRDGVDLLSLRDLLEALGGVLGEGGPNEVRIEFGSIVVELEPGRGTASVDGEPHELSGPLVMALGNLWVPPGRHRGPVPARLHQGPDSLCRERGAPLHDQRA